MRYLDFNALFFRDQGEFKHCDVFNSMITVIDWCSHQLVEIKIASLFRRYDDALMKKFRFVVKLSKFHTFTIKKRAINIKFNLGH